MAVRVAETVAVIVVVTFGLHLYFREAGWEKERGVVASFWLEIENQGVGASFRLECGNQGVVVSLLLEL
jgi:hypothetical protein